MKSRFGLKIAIVVAVFLICFWRVIGFSPSWDAIRQNLSDNIALGLDLKGGTHLILQVQVQDALKSEADQTIDRLRTRLARADIAYTGIRRNDPGSIEDADSIEIQLEGTPTDRVSDVRAIFDEEAPSWLAASSGGSTFALTLRPSELLRLKAETLQQSMSTIENRINGLGLTEPVIQQHGRAEAEHEILVQLPGVSDPARVMNLLQMSAQLEIKKEVGGPYGSPEAARSQNNGILPANSELAHYTDRGPQRLVLVGAQPHRDRPRPARRHCRQGHPESRRLAGLIQPLAPGRAALWNLHRCQHRAESGGRARQSHPERGVDRVAHRVRGRHQQHRRANRGAGPGSGLARRRPSGLGGLPRGAHGGRVPRERIRSARACAVPCMEWQSSS